MKAAIYLCGHGPYREPRIIELQYLRILRYCRVLENKLAVELDVDEVYIDINFPRTEYIQELNNLQRLVKNVKDKKVEAVIVDICRGDSFRQNKYSPIIWDLEKAGAKVYNCFYDDEDALESLLVKRYGKKVNSYYLPNDREEFIELFPALASEVTYEVLEKRIHIIVQHYRGLAIKNT